MVVKTRPNAAI